MHDANWPIKITVPAILSYITQPVSVRKWCPLPLVGHRLLPHWRRPPRGTGGPQSDWWCTGTWLYDCTPNHVGCLWSGHRQGHCCPIGRQWLWSSAHELPLWGRWTTLSHSHQLSWPPGSLVGLWRLQVSEHTQIHAIIYQCHESQKILHSLYEVNTIDPFVSNLALKQCYIHAMCTQCVCSEKFSITLWHLWPQQFM